MICNVQYLQYQNNTKSYMSKYKYFDELAKQSFFKFIYTKALALKLKDWGQIFVLSSSLHIIAMTHKFQTHLTNFITALKFLKLRRKG